MARSFNVKQRGNNKRRQKAVYLIIAEGKNKTETYYLLNFQDQDKAYTMRFAKAGNNTDAESLYKTLVAKWEELGLSEQDGDKGYIVVDIDNDEKKAQKVAKLIRDNSISSIRFIVSNPTFEIWFLMHFKYTTKHFKNGDAVIDDLQKYIPNYDKNVDCYPYCIDKTLVAIRNCEKLDAYHGEEQWPSVDCNPRTDVVDLIKELI